MSKSAFIASLAERNDISRAEAQRMVDRVFAEIEHGLSGVGKSEKYTIGAFGTFSVVERKARTGTNPRTGEPIEIKAGTVLRFRPSAQLKKAAGC